jgi:hypothetical protein
MQIRAFAYRLRIQRKDGPAGCRLLAVSAKVIWAGLAGA